ncbi:MAG: MFS transporter [Calditrichales bacterium]|nr:MAG: MFS transporter [Calditrichales bacterium]
MKKIKGLRWYIIGLVSLATVINYVDRSALAIMWPGMSKDLGIGDQGYAAIMSMFMIAYAISQMLSGKLYDWVGTRVGFVISIVVWSVSAALHAVARGAAGFSVFRFMLGLGEAGNWPGATKSNAEWFPIKERAFAQGIFNSGAAIGSIIAPPLIAFLYLGFGWRVTFVLLGVMGLLWIIPWWYFNKATPDKNPYLSDDEKQYILEGQSEGLTVSEQNDRAPGWGEMLTYRQSWSVITSRFFLDPIWWLFVVWLPIYLNSKFGFNVKEIGMSAWAPYVGAMLGSLFGGWISGYWISKGWTTNRARKSAIVLGGIIMIPALILTAFAAEPIMAIVLIGFILFGFQISMNNIQTLPSDFYAGGAVGSLAGIGGTSAAIGVVIVTNLIPIIVKATSYTPVFLLGACLVPLSIFSVYVFGGQIKRVKLKEK